MRVYAGGWLLLLIYSGGGLVYHLKDDYGSREDCVKGFQEEYAPDMAAEAANAREKGDKCFVKCGQAIAWCVQGERIVIPGLLYPTEHD